MIAEDAKLMHDVIIAPMVPDFLDLNVVAKIRVEYCNTGLIPDAPTDIPMVIAIMKLLKYFIWNILSDFTTSFKSYSTLMVDLISTSSLTFGAFIMKHRIIMAIDIALGYTRVTGYNLGFYYTKY